MDSSCVCLPPTPTTNFPSNFWLHGGENLPSPFSSHCSGRHKDRLVNSSLSTWKSGNKMSFFSYCRHPYIYKCFWDCHSLAVGRGKHLPTNTAFLLPPLKGSRGLAPIVGASLEGELESTVFSRGPIVSSWVTEKGLLNNCTTGSQS